MEKPLKEASGLTFSGTMSVLIDYRAFAHVHYAIHKVTTRQLPKRGLLEALTLEQVVMESPAELGPEGAGNGLK